MLYAAIVVLFVVLVAVSVKWAQAAREVRRLKVEIKVAAATTISHDSALYQIDRRYNAGIERGFNEGLIAAEEVAIKALVEGKPPVMAIRDLRK